MEINNFRPFYGSHEALDLLIVVNIDKNIF
jgi:hypothetical protein